MTWQVPSFVMISGRFFLDPDRPMSKKKIWRSILRLAIAFLFWDFVYQVFFVLSGAYRAMSVIGILMEFFGGPFHFWFLYMLVCLYAIVPFLRSFIANKRLCEYFLILFLVFEFVAVYGVRLPYLGNVIKTIFDHTAFHFALGYSGFFVMGLYLTKHPLPDRVEKLLYCLLPFLLIGSAYLTTADAIQTGTFRAHYTQYLNPNVVVIAGTIYTFFVKRVSKIYFRPRTKYWITKLSEWSFGVYLIHVLVFAFMRLFGLTPLSGPVAIMFAVMLFLNILICNLLVWLIRKIPWIGKKIT